VRVRVHVNDQHCIMVAVTSTNYMLYVRPTILGLIPKDEGVRVRVRVRVTYKYAVFQPGLCLASIDNLRTITEVSGCESSHETDNTTVLLRCAARDERPHIPHLPAVRVGGEVHLRFTCISLLSKALVRYVIRSASSTLY
jgi:hypothetical protein